MNRFRLAGVKSKKAPIVAVCLIFVCLLCLVTLLGATAYAGARLQGSPGVPLLTPTATDTPLSPTATYTPACNTYSVALSTGATIVPGTTDIGNHCIYCITVITLSLIHI